MKLAEALANRADLQKRLEQMRGRLAGSALVQENELPPENPQELLRETERLLSELESYIERVNRTNLTATLSDGTTLTASLARRDVLGLRYGLLDGLVKTASDRVSRYGLSEIRILPTVDVAPLRQQMDEVARERRELDAAIQSVNWTTELEEQTVKEHERVTCVIGDGSERDTRAWRDLVVLLGRHEGLSPLLLLAQHRHTRTGYGAS